MKQSANERNYLGMFRSRQTAHFSLLWLVFILLTAGMACRLTEPPPPGFPTDAPTPTLLAGRATLAPVVTATRLLTSTPAPSAAAVQNCPTAPTTLPVRYDINTTLDMDAHTAAATLKATYRNDTGQPLKQIVMNVEPNRKPNAFTLNRVGAEGSIGVEQYTLNGPRLEIELNAPLAPNCEMTLVLEFVVRPGQITQSYVANTGYFGFTEKQFNLGEWLPEIASYANGAWITPKSWPIGEFTAPRFADFTAKVKATGKDISRLEVIGPGEVTHPQSDTWEFRLAAGRTFTLSASTNTYKLTALSEDAVTIDLYIFQPTGTPPVTPIVLPAAKHTLETIRTSINRFTQLYGPLPYKRLVVVEGDFPDGMEFSGMVFVSQRWFAMYQGTPDTWVTLITAHEVSHQWWYAMVGNDQAEAPFLDEGLALYSELVYLQEKYPALAEWWWNFRVKGYAPQGYVDTKVYDYRDLRQYLNAVYLRGALMLNEIREMIGDAAFFKWMRDYRSANTGKIATFTDFWQALAPDDYTKIAAIRAKYLRVPDPLHPPAATATTAATAATATTAATEAGPR